VTIDNITETAAMLGVSRQTIHWYINKYPELQEHRAAVTSAWKNPYFVSSLSSLVVKFGQMFLREQKLRSSFRACGWWPMPAETLNFLLASRYCETDRLSEVAWNLFGQAPMGWGRVQL
jgi:hypothetical protein